jgi:hypothetical protein
MAESSSAVSTVARTTSRRSGYTTSDPITAGSGRSHPATGLYQFDIIVFITDNRTIVHLPLESVRAVVPCRCVTQRSKSTCNQTPTNISHISPYLRPLSTGSFTFSVHNFTEVSCDKRKSPTNQGRCKRQVDGITWKPGPHASRAVNAHGVGSARARGRTKALALAYGSVYGIPGGTSAGLSPGGPAHGSPRVPWRQGVKPGLKPA